MVSLIGIVICLVLLIVLALKGVNIILMSPLLAIVVALFSSMDVVEALTKTYMTGFANYVTNYFLIFLFGSIFGKLMEDSGAAKSIADAIIRLVGENSRFMVVMSIMIITAVLTYGGISLFVVIYAVRPIARPLFKRMNIPWHLFIGAFFMGMGTFTMTMLPGTPAIQNVIPTTYLGTDLMAAPILGVIATVIIIVFDSAYLRWELGRCDKNGIGFEQRKGFLPDKFEDVETKSVPVVLAVLPLVFLIVILNVFKVNIALSLILACALCVILFFGKLDNVMETLGTGAVNVGGPIINTAAIVGFGGVVGASPGYQFVVDGLSNIPGPPVVQWVIAINLLAGITGSASGGLVIGMNTLAEQYSKLVNPEVLHRLGAMSSGGLDSLPHNGAVITGLTVAGLTHKEGYFPIFMTCTVGPLVTTVITIILSLMMY